MSRTVELLETVSGDRGGSIGALSELVLLNCRRWDDHFRGGPVGVVEEALRDIETK